MQMIVSGARVSRVADVGDDLALAHKFSRRQAVGVALQMGVVENQFFVSAVLVDGCAAALTLKKFCNLAVGGREHRSPGCGRNVDGVMDPDFDARIHESV